MDEDAAVGLVIIMWLAYGLIPLGIVEVLTALSIWAFSISTWWLMLPAVIYIAGPILMWAIHKLNILD